MKLLDKAISKALESALESRRNEPRSTKRRHVEKPYPEFNVLNVEHEVIYTWHGGDSQGVTMDIVQEIQHKQNIPKNAKLEIYNSETFSGQSSRHTIKFTWDDPNNIKEKE